MAKRPASSIDDRCCSVTISRADALRIATAARRAGGENVALALEDAVADILDGQTATVTPRLETCRWIARLCLGAWIGAGVRFATAASEAEFRPESGKI